jgi:hypothetical protein
MTEVALTIAEANAGDQFNDAQQQFEALVRQLHSPQAHALSHSEVERLIEKEGRELLRRLLQAHLTLRAMAEPVRPAVSGADGVERTHHRRLERGLMSLFGPVRVERIAYGARGEPSLCPLDGELNLPREGYSHGLRKIAAQEAAKGSFAEAVEAITRYTAAAVGKRQVEEVVQRAAGDFESFYTQRQSQAGEPTAELVVLSFDSKGVVMRPEDLREATRKAAEQAGPKLPPGLSRRENRNRKRMATVATVYTVAPFVRQAEEVMRELRPLKATKVKRPRVSNKRVWASLQQEPPTVMEAAVEEAVRRDPEQHRQWVVLVDGDRHQLRRLRACVANHHLAVTFVLDFLHVLTYLWKAAYSFHAQGSSEAEGWVTERAVAILQGKSSEVAAGMRRSATLQALTQRERKAVDTCADYLLRYRSLLRYDHCLTEGFPIATGVIEGACRHLVKDRMERTGARWSLAGAEAVLRLRALRCSGDFEEYWEFHLQQERERNHLSLYADSNLPEVI